MGRSDRVDLPNAEANLIDKISDSGSSQMDLESSQLRIGPHKLKPADDFVEMGLPFKGKRFTS